jgi:hypothetical protein
MSLIKMRMMIHTEGALQAPLLSPLACVNDARRAFNVFCDNMLGASEDNALEHEAAQVFVEGAKTNWM